MEQAGPTSLQDPHWFIQWCIQSLGANIDTLNDRLENHVMLLVVLGPLSWIRSAFVVRFWSVVVVRFYTNQAILLCSHGHCLFESFSCWYHT